MGNLLSFTDEVENPTISNNPEPLLQSGIPSQAASLRSEAHRLMLESKVASQQSQSAYRSGSKSQAKTLSDKRKILYSQMNEKNHQAAELIFHHFNRNRPNNVIDLHGLYVTEAMKYLKDKLDKCRSENILQLIVITGIGNNSPNKIAKIKPKVEEYVRENRLEVTCYDGHIVVDLSTNNQYKTTSSQNTDGCIIL